VAQIIDNNHKLVTIIIENNKLKKIAWIIDMHLFFTGDLFNDAGYNLTVGIEQQHNINRGAQWLLVTGLAGAFEQSSSLQFVAWDDVRNPNITLNIDQLNFAKVHPL